jgi:hypothetical protein
MNRMPSTEKALLILLLLDTGIGILHILFSVDPGMGSFFNLTNEENFPIWYYSFQFLLVS